MASDPSKAQGRRVRELLSIAYERELSNELADLEVSFSDWRRGEINAFDVSQAIHDFHQGVSRELYSRYQADPDLVVARAIQKGVISKDEAGADLLEHSSGHLAAFNH